MHVAPWHALHKFVGSRADRRALYIEEWESCGELSFGWCEEESLQRGKPRVERACVLFVVTAPRWLTSAAELRIAAWVWQIEASVGKGALQFGDARCIGAVCASRGCASATVNIGGNVLSGQGDRVAICRLNLGLEPSK